MTEINWQLLEECLDFITENPERWNQSVWALFLTPEADICQTQFCLAGTACFLSDRVVVRSNLLDKEILPATASGNVSHQTWRELAQDLLGLSYDQMLIFFSDPPSGVDGEVWTNPEQYAQFVRDYLKNGNYDNWITVTCSCGCGSRF